MAGKLAAAGQWITHWTGGATGAGLVLVLLPCVALYFGLPRINALPLAGLPVLAVFGIMVLFGALAITAALFSGLKLADRSQALALPEGSVRAAIALALIVLFAIIAIMLHQSASQSLRLAGLSEADKQAVLQDARNQVSAVLPDTCARPATPTCAPEDRRFMVMLRLPASPESNDLAKQLLVLIGTLMTSVTSFYFAARATEPSARTRTPPAAEPDATAATATDAATGSDAHADGCNVAITEATPDHELPPARGGVG